MTRKRGHYRICADVYVLVYCYNYIIANKVYRMGGTTENRILAGKAKEDRRKLFQSTDMTACLIKKLYCKNINMYTYYTVILVINILLHKK